MTTPSKPGTDIEVGAALSPETVRQFASMAMMIPDENTDAVESIVSAILNAPAWDDLSDPWESTGVADLEGKTLIIHGLMRRPSDFKDGLGIFLVVQYTDAKTGEAGVWTTGSVACVAQLARAYAGGWLPLYAQVIVAERPTQSGYRPHHLKFIGRADKPAPEQMPF